MASTTVGISSTYKAGTRQEVEAIPVMQADWSKTTVQSSGLDARGTERGLSVDESIGLAIFEGFADCITRVSLVFEQAGDQTFTGTEVAELLRSVAAKVAHGEE